MRNIYLIRHGEPNFPDGIKCCLGKYDLSLSEKGKIEAKKLSRYFDEKRILTLISSPLARSRETADIISNGKYPIVIADELQEIDTGLWDGLPFPEIKKKYSEYYEQRGKHLSTLPFPGGESFNDVLMRTEPCLKELLEKHEGDLAIVAHACVNQGLLSKWLGLELDNAQEISQAYGSVNLIEEINGTFNVKFAGKRIEIIPTLEQCDEMLKKFNVSEQIIAHSRKVMELALEWTDQLIDKNFDLNKNLIRAASMLHDIARAEKDHSKTGADWMSSEGYSLVANVVAVHHQLPLYDETHITENAIVYLADKKVQECQYVTIDERFELSRKKCGSLVAKVKHRQSYFQAKKVEEMVEEAINNSEYGEK